MKTTINNASIIANTTAITAIGTRVAASVSSWGVWRYVRGVLSVGVFVRLRPAIVALRHERLALRQGHSLRQLAMPCPTVGSMSAWRFDSRRSSTVA